MGGEGSENLLICEVCSKFLFLLRKKTLEEIFGYKVLLPKIQSTEEDFHASAISHSLNFV